MRTITDHKLNGLNDALEITVLDEPGQGGACHEYEIAVSDGESALKPVACRIKFQNGPIKEAGVNGISGEALIAVIIDRLRCKSAPATASLVASKAPTRSNPMEPKIEASEIQCVVDLLKTAYDILLANREQQVPPDDTASTRVSECIDRMNVLISSAK